MAVITETEVSAIIPEIYLDYAIEQFNARTLMARVCAKDSSMRTMGPGDPISVVKPGALSVQTKVQGSPLVPEAPTAGKVTLTLDQHKAVSWAIEDRAKSKSIDIHMAYVRDAVGKLASKVEKSLIALYPEIATEVGTAGTDVSEATILAARQAMLEQLAPAEDWYLFLAPKDEVSLLKEDRLIRADMRGGSADRFENSQIGRIHGFQVVSSTLLPEVAGTQYGMAFHPDAFMLASRALPAPEAMGIRHALRQDPVSGLVFRYMEGYDLLSQAHIATIDILYGVAAMDEDRLAVRILS